jgi:hypothetical protein
MELQMSDMATRSVRVGELVVNLKYVVCVERKQEGSEKITTLELVNGRIVELRDSTGDRVWELAVEGASKETARLK